MIKNKLVQAFFIAVITYTFLISVQSAQASGGCVPVYGGGVSCPKQGEVLVDKKVRNPATGFYVDNLGPSDPKYRPQQIVSFQISVKNPGETAIDKITVTDTLPKFLDYMSGPGTYDGANGKLNWEVSNLAGGDTQVFEVKGRISHQAKLPVDRNVICPTNELAQPINIVDVSASNGQTDRDEARYCIEKEVIVPKVPEAGPENWLISITGLITSLGIGLKLRKSKSS
ncbi:hypothetical protein COY59_00435 [Candidatus Gottesmanbacteria bacterium CG_4_10_14_0_8_um_filter_37_24]|uniref:DUF11 domain-containing protein n=1 Tax=Candidatus Gottesmanbacteria bacterium CG_4_10_14_0_8_um_filter_37_24 TaxID=1974574 RepID=A0A2M7RSI2_9BACT|nr:MAG: hypothetical protein COX23_02525 [Candidatus Gottesmanbacteria bacterium CG23_combo_of_CG06-09_8_20_14_all_37_19]PIZ03263.1 MAG: hypothetical protein COY59_00435 [Candidatus Gottesmanbacteria bacterium CG_4_10_14_0_8_um_filter_37_24]